MKEKVMDNFIIKTDEWKEFNYIVDKNPNLLGYSIATCPITERIDSDLKKINDIDVAEMVITKKEMKDSYCCNIGKEDLIGKYYDKNGFIYYEFGTFIYRFFLKINYFKKLYKSKINGT
jgi:hypothetical protein